jgi:hypothetical protein
MKNIINSIARYLKYVFKGVVNQQLEAGRIERQQSDGTGDQTKKSPEQRKELLEAFTIKQVSQGWRLNAQTENTVVLEYGKKPNHILHFLLCIPTFGFWLIVWIILAASMNIKRRTWFINEYGVILQR